MDVEEVEYVGSGTIALLPEDIFYHISTHFLGEKDRLNLFLSGVSKIFCNVYKRYRAYIVKRTTEIEFNYNPTLFISIKGNC